MRYVLFVSFEEFHLKKLPFGIPTHEGNMALEKKTLLALISTLTTVLSLSLLLLQVHSVLLLKIWKQRCELQRMQMEAIFARNIARQRYHRLRLR